MIAQALMLNLLLTVATPVEIFVVNFPAKGGATLTLGLKGKADVERLGTVTKVAVRLEEVQPAYTALAGMNALVVWVVSPEGSLENLGELEVNGAKASLEATTRFDRFGILITAEPHYMVDRPSSAVVLKNEASRSLRNVPLTIQTGEYEYRDLPSPVRIMAPLVMEARAAMAIAKAAQAETLAEAEFRQARVSVETMEELVRRASSLDVIAPSAHEAIRRAQRAFTQARQSVR